MNAKLSNFSELSNILSVKSSLRTNLMSLFTRFGLGHLLWRITMSSTDFPDSFCTRTAMEHTSSCKWRDTKCALYIC